ncbi:MAG: hypothetical protein GVX96_00120 [Bacteroidetes bacterium]|jgi:hypothetical protein|nr:hypothetical protein [Bacteroidota bacterium]
MHLFKFALLLCLLPFFSCADSERYETVKGDWSCISWTSEEWKGNQCDNNVFFRFHRDKTYRSDIGGQIDTGTYWIDNRFIAFDPDEKLKIKVEIIELTSDTLSFYMNNAGIREKMVLTKTEN